MSGPRIREIASAANPIIKEIRALHMRKARADTGLFVAEGARTLRAALDRGIRPEKLLYRADLRDRPEIAALRKIAGDAGALLLEVSSDALEKISRRDNPPTAIGVFRQRWHRLDDLDPGAAPIWLALEGVRDPGNLGACLRSADAVGAGGVILIGECCDPFGAEAVRATMDSIFAMPLYALGADQAPAFVRAWPGTTIGMAPRTGCDHRQAAYTAPVLLVAGTEQSGLSDALRGACRALVELPMRPGVESLNLAVATGVMLYAARDRLAGA